MGDKFDDWGCTGGCDNGCGEGVGRALGGRYVVFDVPKPLPVGGVKLYGVLEDAEDDPKLARPVLLIRASPSVGACGCAERPKPSNASLPIRL